MLKKKTKKLILSSSIATVTIASIATPIPFIVQNKLENVDAKNFDLDSKNYKYLYNNKYYDSIDDISQELLIKDKLVSNNLYYGNIYDAIFDQQYKRLDINKLRKYDPKRILPAYITSTGNYESDFEKAKRTFINQGLVRYFYLDNQGKLHYDFDSAKQANINNIKVDEVLYYKVKDENGQDIKINPLNESDINKFKKIAINRLKKGEESNDGFKLKIFTKDNSSRLNEEKYVLNQDLTSFIANNDNQDKILWNINKKINNLLCSTNIEEKYDFKLSLNGMVDSYKFQWWKDENGNWYDRWSKNNIETNDTQYIEISNDEKSLIFRNFRINEIEGLLNRFSNRTNFENLNQYFLKNEIEVWGQYVPPIFYNDEAEEAYWKIKLGENIYWIHLNYIGDNKSLEPGVDYKILQNGSKNNGVGFDIELIDKGKYSNTYSYKNNENNIYLNNIFNSLKKSFNDQLEKNNIFSQIIKEFFEKNEDKLKDLIYGKFFQNESSYFYKKSARKNDWSFDEFKVNKEKDKILEYGIYFNENESIKNNLFNSIYRLFEKWDDLKIVIFYKGFPAFEYDKNSLDRELINNFNLSENDLLSIYLKQKLLNLNIQNNNYSKIRNISNLNNVTTYSFIKNDELIFTINNQNMFIVPDNKKDKNGKLNELNNIGERSFNELWYAINSYNRNLERYKRQNNNSIESIKDKLVDNSNVLFLRNGTGNENDGNSSQPLYYSNYLGLKNDFNESIDSLKPARFAYNEFQLKQLKEASNSINPSKIIVLYNIVGEVMNPGVKLDDDMTINTSSDAIYDLEQNLLDNVIRTLLIQKSEDKFFYLNDDGTKTLIKNKVNQIYTLTWNGVEYYFPTFDDSKRYLNSIVELLSTKVEV